MGQKTGNDAWEAAAICEARAQATPDVSMQTLFRHLRDSWIRIANQKQFEQDLAANAARINSEWDEDDQDSRENKRSAAG